MARSGWDDPWQKYASSKPIAVEGGIASSKTRGAMAETWWSKRFVTVLESYGLGGRMTRGRTYARKGQVLSLDVSAGRLVSKVQGSRSTPYAVSVTFVTPSDAQWKKIEEALRSRVGYAAHLLAGEVPIDLEEVFSSAGARLFPQRWSDLRATCSCPDWGDPCKHQAAALYVFADQLDGDPWQLLEWHGRSRDQIVALFVGEHSDSSAVDEIAPWWPLRPGGAPSAEVLVALPIAEPSEHHASVLRRLGVLDATIASKPIADLLVPFYEELAAGPFPTEDTTDTFI